jgi:ABC-type lipoprotein export system ATPase subunit
MHHVSKIYRTDVLETYALRDASLEVPAGDFVAVTGPSGSGKTTFLNVAGLLETFEAGTYELDGTDVSRLSDRARSRLRNEKIGFEAAVQLIAVHPRQGAQISNRDAHRPLRGVLRKKFEDTILRIARVG